MKLTMAHVAHRLVQSGIGNPGVDLFVYQMPETAVKGLLLLPGTDGFEIDHEMRGVLRGAFQVIARDTSPLAAEDRAAAAAAVIQCDQGWTILPGGGLAMGEARVLFMRARHTPIVYPRSETGDIHEASVNFDTMFAA